MLFPLRRHKKKMSARDRRWHASRPVPCGVEHMEPRNLFSISIPGIPGIPSLPGILGTLGITNISDITSYIPALNPPTLSQEWWLHNTTTPGADINAINAWNVTQGSSNVVVAVLDTGFDMNNPDLAGVLWTNPGNLKGDPETGDIHGWNFLNNSPDITDNFVHGTAVSDALHSVAPGVTILPVEIGTSSGVTSQNVIAGINYIIALKKAGVNIVAINASYIDFNAPSTDEINAIKSAGSNGMLYVAAAGNSGMNLNSLVPSGFGSYVSSFLPSNLIWVAATDSQDHLASFSNYGSDFVAVGAPGADMDLALPGGIYASLDGTSFAAPMVSGIAALIKSKFPNATMDQIKNAILNSGDSDPSLAGKTSTGKRVDAYAALQYMIGQSLPTGNVTSFSSTTITGWAFDANLGTGAASVELSIDGVMQPTTYTANLTLSDSATITKLGSTDHGFSIDVSSLDLAYGKHTIKVYALDDATTKTTLLGSGNVTIDTAPTGALETDSNFLFTGYALDSDTPTKATTVKIYLDGKSWLSGTANVNRTDLADTLGDGNTAHGYSIKTSSMPAGIHQVQVYAVDSLTGALILIGADTLSSNRAVTGAVESLTSTNITGYAFDPDSGSGSVQVRYTIDGGAPVLITANINRTDLQSTLGSKAHGFSITLPQLPAGDHEITVDAVDPQTKALLNLADQTITVNDTDASLPTGTVDTLTTTLAAGIVTDTNAIAPLKVRIDIDGKLGKAFASTATDDPTTFNYTYTIPKLAAGPHRVDVYVIDPLTNVAVLLTRQLVGYTTPTGTVESLTTTAAIGCALNPNVSNKQAQVRIDIDGLEGALTTANLKRTDLTATQGATNIGFNIKLPTLPAGDHHITITLIDPTTLTPIILFDGDLTV